METTTKCGKVYAVQLRSHGSRMACPTCGKLIDEESVAHDGYRGSSHAHDGAGSYGLAAHHYYAVCQACSECDCEVCAHEHDADCDPQAEYDDTTCDICGKTWEQVEEELGELTEAANEPIMCPFTGEVIGVRAYYYCSCGDEGGFTHLYK